MKEERRGELVCGEGRSNSASNGGTGADRSADWVPCCVTHLEAAVRDGEEEGGFSNFVNYGGGAGARGIHNTDALSVSAHIYIFNGLLIWT